MRSCRPTKFYRWLFVGAGVPDGPPCCGSAFIKAPLCKGGESRALPEADEARRTSGSGQNFGGFDAAAKFWAPQQELSAVRLTEGLTAVDNPSVNASRCHLPLHKGGFGPCENDKRTILAQQKKEALRASFFDNSVSVVLFHLADDGDVQLVKLLLLDGRRCAHHDILCVLVHGAATMRRLWRMKHGSRKAAPRFAAPERVWKSEWRNEGIPHIKRRAILPFFLYGYKV